MKRIIWLLPLFVVAACHAHTVQGKQTTLETPPKEPQVASERPVRTTPGGMLDPKSMRMLQGALNRHGVNTPTSGQLDDETQASLRKFQRREQMAATGMPDFDTLRKLGLDPKTIYLGGTKRADAKTAHERQKNDVTPTSASNSDANKNDTSKNDTSKSDANK
ncbi:MAG TPA: peptidoglycan-binding domain-containing protein [Polyangia bacterium]|jgi:hypothetical protein|nr:peptidoglycan-binding domain-containing protein [Polyangia bacterium]